MSGDPRCSLRPIVCQLHCTVTLILLEYTSAYSARTPSSRACGDHYAESAIVEQHSHSWSGPEHDSVHRVSCAPRSCTHTLRWDSFRRCDMSDLYSPSVPALPCSHHASPVSRLEIGPTSFLALMRQTPHVASPIPTSATAVLEAQLRGLDHHPPVMIFRDT